MSINNNGFGGLSSPRFDRELPDERIDGGESSDGVVGEESGTPTLDPRLTNFLARRASRERSDGTPERQGDGDSPTDTDGKPLAFGGGGQVRRQLGGGSSGGDSLFGGESSADAPANGDEAGEGLELVGRTATATVYRNGDGDLNRTDADGEFFSRDAETGTIDWARDEDGDREPETIGRVDADGTTTSVMTDTDGDGVPDEFAREPLAGTAVSELEHPDFLDGGLTESEANAALEACAADASPGGVELIAGDALDNGIYRNADGDTTVVLRNGDAYRDNANGEEYWRTSGEVSWSSEGAFGTVNPDGTTTTVELDTDGDGVPDRRVADAVPLAGSNVDELLDQEDVFEGVPIDLLGRKEFFGAIPAYLLEPLPELQYAYA